MLDIFSNLGNRLHAQQYTIELRGIQLYREIFTENLLYVEAASIRVISMTQVKNYINKNDFTVEDMNERKLYFYEGNYFFLNF